MDNQYVFDKDNFDVRKQKPSFWHYVRKIFFFLVLSLVLAVLYYLVFALFFSTDAEKQLQTENRAYENEFEVLQDKEKLLADAVEDLECRDRAIYDQIFHTAPPDLEVGAVKTFTDSYDSMSDAELIRSSSDRLQSLEGSAAQIEDGFKEIFIALADSTRKLPPMSLPLAQISCAQVGASTGERINPFYQVGVRHDGLDIISNTGEPVYATADGQVTAMVRRSARGAGNYVEIRHDGGYVTRYKHLGDILVRKGRRVKKGTVIGYVGMSGHTYAPHLHYELLRDTVVLDPINYFFAAVAPEEYLDMLVMSTATKQSMD